MLLLCGGGSPKIVSQRAYCFTPYPEYAGRASSRGRDVIVSRRYPSWGRERAGNIDECEYPTAHVCYLTSLAPVSYETGYLLLMS